MLTASLDPQYALERVLAVNEELYKKWRTRPPKQQPIDVLVFADPDPLTPAEEDRARKVVAGVAVGLDADADALADVLDMLGLLPAKPAPAAAAPKRRYGQCPECRRTSIPLRKNGLLVGHSRIHYVPVAQARCDGGGAPPLRRTGRRAA
ncbi:hypothetical protein [Nonomuraea gerenzanensis]|uniref:Uncharacterized protein n=1 Tax=Nonomuraea gerenzanensis TaxID=93944 RepID=A0A1M4BKW2_9ACTN|nr:hypothetical protein [Nonomuraea gerenzanensis]UBU10004.1 hypothetical protein LCN96_37385 [Nonomuraea gerenzanensis]SAP16287.1 hypothetical protein BN4615_P10950 [Nonomuraea gerenzanensis]